MSTTTYAVSGMTCGGCAGKVKEQIGRIAGVTGVEVELSTGRVTVTGSDPIDDARVRDAIEEIGYEVKD